MIKSKRALCFAVSRSITRASPWCTTGLDNRGMRVCRFGIPTECPRCRMNLQICVQAMCQVAAANACCRDHASGQLTVGLSSCCRKYWQQQAPNTRSTQATWHRSYLRAAQRPVPVCSKYRRGTGWRVEHGAGTAVQLPGLGPFTFTRTRRGWQPQTCCTRTCGPFKYLLAGPGVHMSGRYCTIVGIIASVRGDPPPFLTSISDPILIQQKVSHSDIRVSSTTMTASCCRVQNVAGISPSRAA